MFEALDRHKIIALDMDGTLVDGPNSEALRQYVLDHPEKTFFIVTHRTPVQCAHVWKELMADEPMVPKDRITQIVPLPERYEIERREDERLRRNSGMPVRRTPDGLFDEGTLFPGERKFIHWKGYVARKLAATIMVDDMPDIVLPGCRANRVAFMNARTGTVERYS